LKHASLSLALVLAACGAPPATVKPPPPAPEAKLETPPATASVERVEGAVIARDAAGRERYRVALADVTAAVPAPDGGAVVLAGHRVVCLGDRGHERWRVVTKHHGGRLLVTPEAVLVSSSSRVDMLDLVDGADRGAVRADQGGVARDGRAPTPDWNVRLRLFPGAPDAKTERVLAVGADGFVLAGASDGSLVGIDPGGIPRFQLGVRGAVKDIEARPDGDFAVTTRAGVVVVGAGGVVRSEPAPGVRPTLAYRARPTAGPPLAEVRSVVALAPDDVWAVGSPVPYSVEVRQQELYHSDGKTWRRVDAPELRLLPHPILSGREDFWVDSLSRGPDGRLLVIGTQLSWSNVYPALAGVSLRVLERAGSRFRERPDLAPALAKTAQHIESNPGAPTYARGPGGREVLCLVDLCLARGLPPSFRPGKDAAAPVSAGAPPWTFFEWSSNGMWWKSRPIAFAGEKLWRLDASGISRDGEVLRALPEPTSQEWLMYDLWARDEDDVWALVANAQDPAFLTHWDGRAFHDVASPLPDPRTVWSSGRHDVWIWGDGLAHFDGKAWQRIAGAPAGRFVPGLAPGEVWIVRTGSLFRVALDPNAQPDVEGATALAPPAVAPSRPLAVGPVDPSVRLERVSIDVDGGPPLTTALGVVEGPGGVVWLHDGHRLVEVDGARARLLYQAPPLAPLACQRCAAPSGPGRGLFVARSLRAVAAGRAADEILWLPAVLSLARAPSGATWAVSASDDDGSPRAVVHGASGLRLVAGLPAAAYADVAPRADDDVWFAGGLGASSDDARAWPEGEGTLVRFDGRAFTRHRAPDGALHAVAATGPAEAWAVGAAGGVLHARSGAVEAFHLVAEDGARLPVMLRAAAAGPEEVWIAGDRSTLLRWDGTSLRRIDAKVAGRDAALTAVIAPGAKPGWVVGPGGIWRVVRAR
jgi:hypothetical protein